MATKKTTTTTKKRGTWGDGAFTQEARKKLEARVSSDLDARIEAVAKRLGTTKNSIITIGTLQFVAKLEEISASLKKTAKIDAKALVTEALKELSEVV